MMIRNSKGIMIIEQKPHYTKENEKAFDKRFGINGWKFVEPICSYCNPSCGYGEPKRCSIANGRCIRPKGIAPGNY